MSAVLMKRTLAGLVPADAAASELLTRVPLNATVRASIVRPRNMKLHARYWVLCDLVATHHAELNTRDQVHEVLKILTGHCDVIAMRGTGEVIRVPRSISFAAMSADEFEAFYRRACDAVVEHLLPGVSLDDVRDEVLRMVA